MVRRPLRAAPGSCCRSCCWLTELFMASMYVYYLLGIFLCEFSFCFSKELHSAFSSPLFLGAHNTELSKICIKHYLGCDTFLKLLERAALTCFCQRAGLAGTSIFHHSQRCGHPPCREGSSLPTPCSTAKPRGQLEPHPKTRICSCCWFP